MSQLEREAERAAFLESYTQCQTAWIHELLREEPDGRVLMDLHVKLSQFELILLVLGVDLQ
jgi:hypothetical protein